MPTSGISDAKSNSTVFIATSLSVIILVLTIVTCVLVIIILVYSRIPKKSGVLVLYITQWKLYCSSFMIYRTSIKLTD